MSYHNHIAVQAQGADGKYIKILLDIKENSSIPEAMNEAGYGDFRVHSWEGIQVPVSETIDCTPTFKFAAIIAIQLLRQEYSKRKPNEVVLTGAIAIINDMATKLDKINSDHKTIK